MTASCLLRGVPLPFFRLRLLAAPVLSLALLACSGQDDTAPAGTGTNALLGYVPVDTPFVAANLERLPQDVVDVYLQRMQPVLDEMQKQLTAARADLENAPAAAAGNGDPARRLALAVLQELDGRLSRPGMAELGLDIAAHKALYGWGAFPVVRLGLADPGTLRSTVARILNNADIDAPELTYQDVRFWRLEATAGRDSALAIYVSILPDHLVVGLLPPAIEPEFLPAFLGVELPAASDAAARLAELNHSYGYTPYGSAILDLHRLADEFLQPDAAAARTLAALGEYDAASISRECAVEIHGIIDKAPQITAGTSELTTSAIAYQYRVLSPAGLAGQLAALVARVPQADAGSDRVFDFSFGMRFGAVRDFLREKALAIAEEPYLCEYLQDLNASAEQSLAQLDQPMPPFLNNFRGLRVGLDRVGFRGDRLPSDALGHLALHVEQPEMFVGMAKMFLPDLSELPLSVGGQPVRLPGSLIPVPDLVAFAAMSEEAIGLSVGPGEEATLLDFLVRDPGPEGMFLSASYDTAAYLEYTERLNPPHDSNGCDAHDMHAVSEAARDALRATADRSVMTLRFDPGGLVIDGRVTFRP